MADIVEILIVAKNLTKPAFAEARGGMTALETSTKKFQMVAAGAAVATGAVVFEAVKMASSFQSKMTLLTTQAGVAHSNMKQLTSGVLDLAGQVGFSPNSLAEALFHVESAFESQHISAKKALDITKIAAEGAAVGQANLVDVTNALTAAIASGIPGTEDAAKAMGVLNATVGVGDMTMQNLADALGTGLLATVKGFGLNINDVSAALATFGDNNIRGAKAGTDLRMAVQALAHPVATGAKELANLGLKTDTLSKDMQKGGLKLALQDLIDHMNKAGVSAKEQGEVITTVFGKRAGIGLNILVDQFDRLKSKYEPAEKGAKNFGKAWEETQKTFSQTMKQLQGAFDSLMISIGMKLMPVVQSFVNLMLQHKTATLAVIGTLATLVVGLGAFSIATKLAAVAMYLFRDSTIAAEAGMVMSRLWFITLMAAVKAQTTATALSTAATRVWVATQAGVSALVGVYQTVVRAITFELMLMKADFVAAGGGFKGMMAALSGFGPIQGVKTAFREMRAASVAAGGGVAGLAAGFKSLNAAVKGTIIIAALVAIAAGVYELEKHTKAARVSIDDLATSLENGVASGKILSPVLDDLQKAQDGLVKATDSSASAWDKFAYSFTHFGAHFRDSGTSAQAAANDYRDLGAAIGKIAQSEGVNTATSALKLLNQQGVHIPTKYLKDYNKAIKETELQSKLTAVSEGKFGWAALATQKALAKQKAEADGLRQSLQALDAINQAAYGSETAFYQAIHDATKGIKDNGKTLNIHTDAGRKNRDLINAMAAATDDLTSKMADQGDSWKSVNKKYEEGYNALVKTAMGMGDTRAEAKKLANQLLNIPADTTIKINAKLDDLETKLKKAKASLRTLPPSQQVDMKAYIGQLEAAIRKAKGEIASVHGKTVTLYSKYVSVGKQPGTGTVLKAGGGLLSGPGSGTSDDIPLMASNGEYVVKASAVQKYGPRFLDALNSGSLPAFATGGSVTKAEQSARNSAASQFDISFFGRIAGYKHNPFEKSLEAAASLGDLVSTLNKWRSTIKAALSGVQETRLLDHLTNVGRSLIKHEKALDKVNEALTKAKDKLSSLKDAAAQLKDSVKSGIISGANITGTAQSTGLTSTGRIMDQLTMDRDKAKALADSLKQLKSMGLNSQSLSEIAQAGVSGGGLATAQALLSASGGQIDQINSLEKQLKASADSSGKTTASAVYAASIKHADKVVKALEKHQASLEKAIEKMTKALEKLITKALGIKHHASGGAAGGASWINEMGAELVHLPDGSTVYPAGQSRQMAMAGGGSDAPIVINLEVGGRHFEQLWVDTGRRVVRTRGGNVQAALGRPGS